MIKSAEKEDKDVLSSLVENAADSLPKDEEIKPLIKVEEANPAAKIEEPAKPAEPKKETDNIVGTIKNEEPSAKKAE